jgi:peroxiredoxin
MKDKSNSSNTTVQRAIIWVMLIFVAGVAWTYISRTPVEPATQQAELPPNPKEGFTAPDFTLELLEGGEITLSDLRGNPVIINFWATWCGPCREEMPAIEKVYRDYKDLGLVVIGLNLTSQDTEQAVTAFIQEFDLTFPIALDRNASTSYKYQLKGLPTTYFINSQGVIQSVVVGGPMSEALIQSRVEALFQDEQ